MYGRSLVGSSGSEIFWSSGVFKNVFMYHFLLSLNSGVSMSHAYWSGWYPDSAKALPSFSSILKYSKRLRASSYSSSAGSYKSSMILVLWVIAVIKTNWLRRRRSFRKLSVFSIFVAPKFGGSARCEFHT